MTWFLMIFVHLAALIPLILWNVLPKCSEKKVLPFILPGFAGLACFWIAEANDDWIDVWELILNQLIASLVPSNVVIDIRISHAFYLFAAWATGFATAYLITLFWRRRDLDEKGG